MRLWIDANRRTSAVVGPEVAFEQRWQHNPYRPTEQIRFDWKKGFLLMESPGAAAFTGFISEVGNTLRFSNGVTLEDVTIANPDGIYEPTTEDRKFIAFAFHSRDGAPLADTKSASLSLVSTSFNTGFSLGEAGRATVRGELPVLVARVGATIRSDALNGMRYTFRDWHMQAIGEGVVQDGVLRVPNDKPVFVVELERQRD